MKPFYPGVFSRPFSRSIIEPIFSPSSVSFLGPLIGFPPILFTGVKGKKLS